MNTQDRTIRDWKPFETAPKDREILVYYTNQNVYLLVKYDDIHKHWTSKGIPKMGLENQRLLWIDIPELKQPEKQEIEIAEETIKKIYKMVLKNGSADREWVLHKLSRILHGEEHL